MSCNLYSVWKHHVHEICEIAWSSQRFFITEFFRGKGNNCFKSWQINHFMNYNKYEHLYQHIRSQWMSLYRTFLYVISENQLVKDQRKYRTCSRNFISYQVCYFTVDTVISFSLWPFFFFEQLSVVEYDPGTHDLQTTSLHFFEESSMKVVQSC